MFAAGKMMRSRQGYRATVMADEPVAYWRLGEASGTTAADEIGAYNGNYVGNTALGQAGISGDGNNAVAFSQTVGRVTVANNAAFRPASATVELWAKQTSTTAVGICYILRQGSIESSGLAVFSINNNMQLWAASNATTWAVQKSTPITLGAWTHYVITYDGSAVRAYKNGIEIGSAVLLATLRYSTVGGIRIGSDDDNSYPFSGTIDEVAIYSKALTQDRILAHYNAASP